MSENSYYNWKRKYGGLCPDELRLDRVSLHLVEILHALEYGNRCARGCKRADAHLFPRPQVREAAAGSAEAGKVCDATVPEAIVAGPRHTRLRTPPLRYCQVNRQRM
jgi:hypothetical protein